MAFALLMVGCGSAPQVGDGEFVASEPFVAGSPFFLVHPTSVDYDAGAAIRPLEVRVRERDGVSVSFQWFRAGAFTNTGGTEIPGATGGTFTPDGPGYFFAVATGTDGESGEALSRASHPARIRVGEVSPDPRATLAVTANQRQYIRGFGGMGNAFWIGDEHGNTRPDMYMQMRDIEKMFDPDGPLAFNIFRIHVFPAPIEDVLSGRYAPFMAQSNAQLLDFVSRVGDFGGYVVAAPWTAPFPHWKHNNSLMGSRTYYRASGNSHLRREHFRDYAEFLRDWAQEMADRGAPIHAISIQNEPTYDPGYYAMLWTAEQQREFMAEYGRVITGANAGAGVPGRGGGRHGRVRLMGGSPHNNVHWNNAALNDPQAREHLEIVAYHTYGDWGTRSAPALDGSPRRETWMMEKNVNTHAQGGAFRDSEWDRIWIVMNEIHHVIAHNESSVYTWWYLKRFYSMIGEGAFGTVNGEILPRGYGMGHFSRFLSDTVRVEASLSGHRNAIGRRGHIAPGRVQTSPGIRGVRVLAGIRTSNPGTWQEMELKAREDMVSVLMFDNRTGRGQSADIRVELPPGFTATSAYGIVSGPNQRHAPALVVLDREGDSAFVSLPSNSMVSLRFRGEWRATGRT
ncbi:MAG: hypothetical protein FWB79_02040 [Treponema sp.]|nr:hypothetical protein [Treponema sp.]